MFKTRRITQHLLICDICGNESLNVTGETKAGAEETLLALAHQCGWTIKGNKHICFDDDKHLILSIKRAAARGVKVNCPRATKAVK